MKAAVSLQPRELWLNPLTALSQINGSFGLVIERNFLIKWNKWKHKTDMAREYDARP